MNDTTKKRSGLMKIVIALVAATGLGGAAVNFIPGAKDSLSGITDLLGQGGPAKEIGSLFSGATDALSGITDVDTAKEALPAFDELGGSVENISGLLDGLPEAARGPITELVTESLGKLQPVINKVLAIPGVGSVLNPVLRPFMAKLQGLLG